MNEFVARTQPYKIVVSIALMLGFVAIGVWMTGILDKPVAPPAISPDNLQIYPLPQSSSRYPEWFVKLMGWVSIILFGGLAILGAKRLTNPSDHLRINRLGVMIPSYTDRLITWDEISDITTWTHRGQTSVVFKLRDPARFNRPAWKRMIDSLNKGFTGGDIGLSMTGTNRTLRQALDAIETFRPKT